MLKNKVWIIVVGILVACNVFTTGTYSQKLLIKDQVVLLQPDLFIFSGLARKSVTFSSMAPASSHHISTAPAVDTTRDRDKDGIADSVDKCPDVFGVIQYDGCPVPDSDHDGVADNDDECPTVAGLVKYKGCKAPDKDGDKINDDEDLCPDQPGVARYGGCPVGDADKDGINDDDDKCKNAPGPALNAGCPEEKSTPARLKKKKG